MSIRYRYWFNRNDVLDASVVFWQSCLMKQNGTRKKPKAKAAKKKRRNPKAREPRRPVELPAAWER
jgi:hypothetical protein